MWWQTWDMWAGVVTDQHFACCLIDTECEVTCLSIVQVMAANGVSHQVVADDLEGVRAVLCWLSFVPPVLGGPLPALPSRDPSDRPVTVSPAQGRRSNFRAPVMHQRRFAGSVTAVGCRVSLVSPVPRVQLGCACCACLASMGRASHAGHEAYAIRNVVMQLFALRRLCVPNSAGVSFLMCAATILNLLPQPAVHGHRGVLVACGRSVRL